VRRTLDRRKAGRQCGVPTQECSAANAKKIAQRFKSFDRPDDISRQNRLSGLALELHIDHFAKHPQGELRQPHPPACRSTRLRSQPTVRVREEIFLRQVGHKSRTLVEHGPHGAAARYPSRRSHGKPPSKLAKQNPALYHDALIYFDHNATSPLCAPAREAWLEACEKYPANPASPHRLGGRAEAALENARLHVAEWLGCSPLDVVWTSGATEANNAVFYHARIGAETEAWVSAIEHPSVLRAATRSFGRSLCLIPVTNTGTVDLGWLADQLKRRRPAIVAIMAANNETGVLQPWREALRLCRENGVPLACDAAQWIGKLDSAGLGECNFVTGCAHKFGGPVGVGFMKVPAAFHSLIVGGEQEHGLRAGTQNVAGVLAMTAAWRVRNEQLARGHAAARAQWRDAFLQRLASEIAAIEPVGLASDRLWNTATLLMPPRADCRNRWVVQLDKAGFAVSTGSACASGKAKTSHVLTAMGYPPEAGERMLRFSSGWENSAADWAALLDGVVQTCSATAPRNQLQRAASR
jgi:cysteine desulfurase